MFGSNPNPFGQSANSPFGSPSGFGQTSNASNNNPFAPKPFGTTATTPFGSQTGTSLFGGTSTGVFGAATQSPSPFGASSSPAFGSSTPAFGASSTPAFGGSSVFGQKPAAFGAFGSTTPQPSPFGSTAQPSQPAFGTNLFGSTPTSTPFGAPTQPTGFGATTTTSQPFGTGASAGSPLFGSGGAFGSTATTSAFGSTATASAFGASTTPAFSFSSSTAFGQSASAFSSNPFGTTTTSPFGAQSSMFGPQTTTSAFANTGFGQSTFGTQRGGSRVAPYTPTTEPDNSSSGAACKLESISAMPVYKDKSHEELRWEDYQLGDKGGPMPASQPFNAAPAPQPSVLGPSPAFSQSSSSLFSNSSASNIFAPKTQTPTAVFNTGGFGPASNSSPSIFNPTSSPSLFSTTTASPFSTTTPSLFPSTTPFAPSTFSPQVPASNPVFSSNIFSNVAPTSQAGSGFGQSTVAFGPSTTPSFSQTNLFSSPSTGFANSFLSTPPLTAPSNSLGFNQATPSFLGQSQPAQQTNNAFSIFSQPQPANTGASAGGLFGPLTATQNPVVVQQQQQQQPVPATNPFGTLPAMPQMSIGRGGTTPSIQYGISSMPVPDRAAPVRISSFLTTRHLSQRRVRLPARKYNPKTDGAKLPFYSDEDESNSTPKADALFVPRENPRALVIRPAKASPLNATEGAPPAFNGFHSEAKDGDHDELKENPVKANGQKANGAHDEDAKEGSSYKTLSGHRAGEAAIVYEHGAGIEALMPKLRRSDYYTEPRIQELAAKERAEPGFCQRVSNFVVGRNGYGSIKFLGETDVRRLDLESLVQFNNREVIVYMDDTKKPPVGQGLNKPAEVTLLNIKCFDKKTGRHYTDGPKIQKYADMLKRKAKDQGAQFVSYDPVSGEWKFRVDHFSAYKLSDEDQLVWDHC